MANDHYTRGYDPQPTQRVGSTDLKGEFQSIEGGFDSIQFDVSRTLRQVGGAEVAPMPNAISRALKLLSFDAAGNPEMVAGGGRYRGDWVTATAYVVSDYFRDATSKNIYSTVIAHTAGVLATDITDGKVRLAINVEDVEIAKAAAEAAAGVATTQAQLATTNGAAQVALAAAQAQLATTQADAARAIANFAGVWTTLSGALTKPATVYHNGLFYVLVNNLANVAVSEPGVSADWLSTGGGLPSYTYDQRGDLRANPGQFSVVDGLGLFQHVTGSDEPDDDESCFATSTGRWLLQAAHWDVVSMWQLPDDAVRDEYDEDEPARFASSFASSFASKVITGTATCAITSVNTSASTSFTGTVTGAAVGDRVIATPPVELGATNADTGRLSYHAWVSAANTVTVMLTNASAAAAATNTAIRTAWPITVIKS